MPLADSRLFDSHHAQIRYTLEGQAGKPVLVLSNSLGMDFSMWDPQVPEFVKSFRVLRYDTRGHGQSSVAPGPYSTRQLAGDVLTLVDGLIFARFDFYSMYMVGMCCLLVVLIESLTV